MEIQRFYLTDNKLNKIVNFIWYFETEAINVSHKLLPTDNIDVLLNFGDEIKYEYNNEIITAPQFHVNGLRDTYSYIYQSGIVKVFGISFKSFGLYPFIQNKMTDFTGKIINLEECSKEFTNKLKEVINPTDIKQSISNIINVLEIDLIMSDNYQIKTEVIKNFIEKDEYESIQQFCNRKQINIKWLERACLECTGYLPQTLSRIHKFQNTVNQIVFEKEKTLIDIAYDNCYADQAHLNREFKGFAGIAPRKFTIKKDSIKENIKYKYRNV